MEKHPKLWSIDKIAGNALLLSMILSLLFVGPAEATTDTVTEQEPRYKYAARPSEKLYIERAPSKQRLVCNSTVGVVQGVDTNPLLDPTKKADAYIEETVDMHFKYPIANLGPGPLNSRFGFNIANINYYNITDVNIFDGVLDARLEQDFYDKFTLSVGYVFEPLIFPNDRNGSYLGNELNVSLRHKITKTFYQKLTYKLIFREFISRKAYLGNGTAGTDLRQDLRNLFEHEFGIYPTNNSKVRLVNQFFINESNDQYYDYYDYINYRVGLSLTQFFTDKLYGTTAFYYQRRDYDSRIVSDRDSTENDNLFLVTGSLLYDLKKDLTVFINYSHTENHTNEPLQKYGDTMYSTGVYYSF